MTAKHARLAAAVADAMAAQNFSQNNLSRVSGVGQSMISAALLGKYDLKEEKWRMICEALALDYDGIIADPEPERIPVEDPSDPADDIVEPAEEEIDHMDDEEKHVLELAGRYMAAKLREDISRGTDMSLEDLFHLLSLCKKAQEMTQ